MSKVIRVLVVDDHVDIRTLLAEYLTKHGLQVHTAEGGEAMRAQFSKRRFDVVLLDLMMPGEDGITLCKQLRQNSNIPIIMLTAMGEETDKIIGIEIGADDYIAKPFNPRELAARIKAVLRRTALAQPVPRAPDQSEARIYKFADWQLDLDCARLIKPDGNDVELTAGEFSLLTVLVQAAPRVLSRDYLLDITVGREATPFDRAIDIQISRLRQKLEPNPKAPIFIKTIRGQGYSFSQTVSKS